MRGAIPALRKSLDAAGHLEAVMAKAAYANRIQGNEVTVDQQCRAQAPDHLKRCAASAAAEKLDAKRPCRFRSNSMRTAARSFLRGPDAGGKTVLIKSLGLIALMAQAGIPVPAAADGHLPMMDGIYVEIGDMQSLADDLSTFSSHVKSLAAILSNVTRESLVLLDEIGGGTAPEEGGAIAESILEHLTRIGAFTVATTHYGRLLLLPRSRVVLSMVRWSLVARLLHRPSDFEMGVPGSSHAFDIAERYGLKKGLVARARDLRGEEGARIDELVNSLEILQRDARDRKAESERELGAARIARVDYERKRNEIEDIRKTAKGKATQEAEEILKRANTFIEKAVREAKEAAMNEARATTASKQQEDLKTVRLRQEQDRKKLLKDVEDAKPKFIVPSETTLEVEVGANVRLKSNPGQIATVLSMKGNDVEIEIGSLRMRTKKDQLEVISSAEAKEKKKSATREISQATNSLSSGSRTPHRLARRVWR